MRVSVRTAAAAVLLLATAALGGEIPVGRQAGPDDKHVIWTVAAGPRTETISCTLKESVPSGSWVRFAGANLRCIVLFRVESLSWQMKGEHGEIAVERRYSREEHAKDWAFFVNNPFCAAGKTARELPAGAEILASGRAAKAQTTGGTLSYRIETASDWNGPWKPVSAWTVVEIAAGEPVSLQAFLKADATAYVLYADAFGNPAYPGKRTVTVSNQDGEPLATRSVDNKPVTIIPAAAVTDKTERIRVTDDRGLEAWSNARNVGAADRTYFGELHFHSEFSGDGYRPVRDCLASAFDELGLDFAALGDHFPFQRGYTLQEYFDVLDNFNKPPEHVTLLAYELGLGNGHMNPFYRTRAQADRFEAAWASLLSDERNSRGMMTTLEPFFSRFDAADMFAIPHHTNHTSAPVIRPDGQPSWRNFNLRMIDTRYIPVIEMCQARGAFETEDTDTDWHVRVGGYGSSLRTALARGFRIGFVGGSDNHHGWATRLADSPDYCSLTAVQAPELTREAIFDAIKARRTYATTGARILLDFRLNGSHPMGSEVRLSPTEKRVFTVSVKGTADIERIEIVSQGAVIAKLDPGGGRDFAATWTDPRPDCPPDDCYYYLRVRQADGHCAWSSPIWVDYAPPNKQPAS